MKSMKTMKMKAMRAGQEGVMLLEALIGILIFSLGVLALVAMQAVSISNVSNAQYRTEAAFLANEILSQIWLDRGVNLARVPVYAYPGGPAAGAWVSKIQAPGTGLPGAGTYTPTIAIAPVAGAPPGPGGLPGAYQVTVTVFWRAPDAISTSNHVAIAIVSNP